MKKTFILAAVILSVAILSLSAVNPAMAAELDRGGPGGGGDNPGGSTTTGNGHQGTTGTGTGVPVNDNINLDGVLSDLIHANLAAALGITPEELAVRLDAGETFAQIALSLGFDSATISDILTQARADALAQAVASGLITQAQADWLASRGSQTPATGYGSGICDGTGDCVPDGPTTNAMVKNGPGKGVVK